MPVGYNNQNASLNKSGGLSLGNAGRDDAAGHATYGYAKNDVTFTIPATAIISDTLPALTYATGDIPTRLLAASTTHKVTVPFSQWFNRSFVGSLGVTANPHGILVKSLAVAYRVNGVTLTSFTTLAINTAPLVAAAALPTVTAMTAPVSGNTLTTAANVYLAIATVTTPAFINVDDTLIWAVGTIVTPMGSTCDILGASWRVAYAMY